MGKIIKLRMGDSTVGYSYSIFALIKRNNRWSWKRIVFEGLFTHRFALGSAANNACAVLETVGKLPAAIDGVSKSGDVFSVSVVDDVTYATPEELVAAIELIAPAYMRGEKC